MINFFIFYFEIEVEPSKINFKKINFSSSFDLINLFKKIKYIQKFFKIISKYQKLNSRTKIANTSEELQKEEEEEIQKR